MALHDITLPEIAGDEAVFRSWETFLMFSFRLSCNSLATCSHRPCNRIYSISLNIYIFSTCLGRNRHGQSEHKHFMFKTPLDLRALDFLFTDMRVCDSSGPRIYLLHKPRGILLPSIRQLGKFFRLYKKPEKTLQGPRG